MHSVFSSRACAAEIQQRTMLRVFAQAETAFHERLVHGQQDEPFLVGSQALHGGVIREVAVQNTRQTKSGVSLSNPDPPLSRSLRDPELV